MTDQHWIDHAYPLKQIRIELQGTKHSDRESIISQLETVLARLKAGDTCGCEHDDDFGYRFSSTNDAKTSFFEAPAGSD